jgi:D-alanyl-D-alanine dipeptidase
VIKIPIYYKILNRFKSTSICCIVALLIFSTAKAQDTAYNKYGLWVISNIDAYFKSIENDTGKEMLDIKKYIPSIVFELKYADTNNFMHTKLYPSITTSYLRKNAITALAKVQKLLRKKNLGIKIWDAYRPYAITEKMWKPVQDSRYAADPKFGSGHNRGIAIDITLINLKTGKALDMGTGFDNFSDTAHSDFTSLPAAVLANRIRLKNAMEKYGFKVLDTEWWHFYLPDTKHYELLNLSFQDLKQLK